MSGVKQPISELSIKRKITAIFSDGSRKSNLGIPSVLDLIKESGAQIPVTVDPSEPLAATLLSDLADQSGFTVIHAEEGTFLAQPTVEVVPITVDSTLLDTVLVSAEKTRGGIIMLGGNDHFTDVVRARDTFMSKLFARETYPDLPGRFHQDLTQTFQKGKSAGQIASLFKDLKHFGPFKVRSKLLAFRKHVTTSPDPVFRKYMTFLKHGYLPHHTATHVAPKRVDMDFVKLYLVFEVLAKVETMVEEAS